VKRLILQKLSDNSFLSRVCLLVSGTAIAQIIALSVLPILTRLYEPEAFSVLAVFTAALSLITVNACLRFEIAIPLPKFNKMAAALCLLAVISVLFFVLILTLIVIFLPNSINILTNNKLNEILWLLPPSIFAVGVYNALQFWSTRKKQFGLISKTRVVQSTVGTSIKLVAGYFACGSAIGLVFGQMFAQGSGFISLMKKLIRVDWKIFSRLKIVHLKLAFVRYVKFPKYSTLEAFANTGGIQIPIILISYYAIGPEAGYMMIAMQLLSAPMSLIGNAVAQVYLSEGAERYNSGGLKDFTHATVVNLAKLAMVPLLVVAVTAPVISPYLLGEEWQRAGTLISWMTPWYFMQFITSPVSMALHITNNQKVAFVLQLFGLILRLGCVLGAAVFAKNMISEAFAVSGFIFYCAYMLVVLNVLSKSYDA